MHPEFPVIALRGSASEKVSPEQFELLLALAEEPQAPVAKTMPRRFP